MILNSQIAFNANIFEIKRKIFVFDSYYTIIAKYVQISQECRKNELIFKFELSGIHNISTCYNYYSC